MSTTGQCSIQSEGLMKVDQNYKAMVEHDETKELLKLRIKALLHREPENPECHPRCKKFLCCSWNFA